MFGEGYFGDSAIQPESNKFSQSTERAWAQVQARDLCHRHHFSQDTVLQCSPILFSFLRIFIKFSGYTSEQYRTTGRNGGCRNSTAALRGVGWVTLLIAERTAGAGGHEPPEQDANHIQGAAEHFPQGNLGQIEFHSTRLSRWAGTLCQGDAGTRDKNWREPRVEQVNMTGTVGRLGRRFGGFRFRRLLGGYDTCDRHLRRGCRAFSATGIKNRLSTHLGRRCCCKRRACYYKPRITRLWKASTPSVSQHSFLSCSFSIGTRNPFSVNMIICVVRFAFSFRAIICVSN